jgi:hypothetical protein
MSLPEPPTEPVNWRKTGGAKGLKICPRSRLDSERFRSTPRTCRSLPVHPEPAVSWHSGFRRGAHARPKATTVHHAARRCGGVAARGARAAAGDAGYWPQREWRYADNQRHLLPELASDLVRREVAAIVANSAAARVAKTVTTTVPIVFVSGEDPVRSGLVDGLSRPGGNITVPSI